ncbi:MFS transporter [Phocaeicola sp.]
MNSKQDISRSGKAAVYPVLFGFFVMGFVDVVGIATNYVKEDFALSDTLANLIPMMVFLWFALFSVPTGILMGKTGRRNTVVAALVITALAMLLPLFFYDFSCVLLAFALLGIGNTMLQVALNPMAASVVHPGKITSVLTLGQFFKAISSFLGPVIAGAAASFWGDWKLIFIVYSLTTLLSIGWLLLVVRGNEKKEETKATFKTTLSLFKDKYIVLLFLGILFIVGIDVGLNTTIPKLLMEKADLPLSKAGLGTSLYFAARTAGAFIGAILLAKMAAVRFLKVSMALAIASFLLLLFAESKEVMFAMIVVVGLACSNVFSILFSFALRHKPDRDNEISALMIMGVSGGALVTPFMGVVADTFGQVAGLSILLICMLYIGFAAFRVEK